MGIRPSKTMLIAAAGLLICCVLARLSFLIWETNSYRGAVPPAIGTYGLARTYNDREFAALLLPVRAEVHGAVVFKLTSEAVANIRARGLAFLNSANREYRPWAQTPLPANWFTVGTWPQLQMAHMPTPLYLQLLMMAQSPGSFYTTDGRGRFLMAAPRLGLLLFTYYP